MIRSIGQQILDETYGDSAPRLGDAWGSRWLNRYPKYNVKTGRPLEIERRAAQDPAKIAEWYNLLAQAREEYSIKDSDIYNVDQSGFRIGCGKPYKVVVIAGEYVRAYIPDPGNRESMTLTETICGDFTKIEPQVIMAATTVLEKHVLPELHGQVLLCTSPTGYSNCDLALEWLKHFD